MPNNYLESFVSENIPGFIAGNHPQFKLFLEAYYEYMELQNTGSANSVLELFKELPNPGAIVNDARVNRDIDETLNQFIDYFRREVMPISVELAAATDRFTIKKIRDVYLSKGTPKSFKLLFRLIYDQEIDIYETNDDIIETSEGTYLGFPVVYFQVVQYNEIVQELDLTLAPISDSELSQNSIVTILSGNVIGTYNKREVLKVQLANSAAIELDRTYAIFDTTDSSKYIIVRPLTTITEVVINKGGSYYEENDNINFVSNYFNRRYQAQVVATESSPITHISVRNRGQFYKKGDMFVFRSDDVYDGIGGYFTVTEVDGNGRITEIDGTKVRTGILNNGFLSNDFEEVIVPIINGGAWKTLPRIEFNPAGTNPVAQPYNIEKQGYGFEAVPVSETLGNVQTINFIDAPYFFDSDDISLSIPRNLLISNQEGLEVGQVVSLQTFVDETPAFLDDSENMVFNITSYRSVETDYQNYHAVKFTLPTGFDSDLFQWFKKEYTVDSDFGVGFMQYAIDSDSSLRVETTYDSDSIFDGPNLFSITGNATTVNGTTSFGGADTDHEFGENFGDMPSGRLNVTFYENRFIDQLDKYHFDQMKYNIDYSDSELIFNWERIKADPTLGVNGNVGSWVDTGLQVQIAEINGSVVKVMPANGNTFPTDSEMAEIGKDKYKLVRLSVVTPSGTDSDIDLKITNVVNGYSVFDVTWNIGAVAQQGKAFVNENGFLNSPSGGVLQDNFFYSEHTYIIKSNLSIDTWRNKIKTMLHPAGKIMFGEVVIEQPIDVVSPQSADASSYIKKATFFNFSSALDHFGSGGGLNAVCADNQLYKTNSYEINGRSLTVDSFTNLARYSDITQEGNAFWDYEPIGLVKKEPLTYTGYGSYVNFDPFDQWNKVTSQDSDGNGFVKSQTKIWSQFDGSIQDLYKTENRRMKSESPPIISRTYFRDAVSELYNAYDSDIPSDVFMRFGDSDYRFQGIDYSRLRSENETRNFPVASIPRQIEYEVQKQRDFSSAMREDNSLKFTSYDVEYKNFDAYHQKWNVYNEHRDNYEIPGWQINGWHSFVQNTSQFKSRLRRNGPYSVVVPKMTLLRTPLDASLWNSPASDWWAWIPTYNSEINNTTEFDYDTIRQDENMAFDYDPEKWMKQGRRTR